MLGEENEIEGEDELISSGISDEDQKFIKSIKRNYQEKLSIPFKKKAHFSEEVPKKANFFSKNNNVSSLASNLVKHLKKQEQPFQGFEVVFISIYEPLTASLNYFIIQNQRDVERLINILQVENPFNLKRHILKKSFQSQRCLNGKKVIF